VALSDAEETGYECGGAMSAPEEKDALHGSWIWSWPRVGAVNPSMHIYIRASEPSAIKAMMGTDMARARMK